MASAVAIALRDFEHWRTESRLSPGRRRPTYRSNDWTFLGLIVGAAFEWSLLAAWSTYSVGALLPLVGIPVLLSVVVAIVYLFALLPPAIYWVIAERRRSAAGRATMLALVTLGLLAMIAENLIRVPGNRTGFHLAVLLFIVGGPTIAAVLTLQLAQVVQRGRLDGARDLEVGLRLSKRRELTRDTGVAIVHSVILSDEDFYRAVDLASVARSRKPLDLLSKVPLEEQRRVVIRTVTEDDYDRQIFVSRRGAGYLFAGVRRAAVTDVCRILGVDVVFHSSIEADTLRVIKAAFADLVALEQFGVLNYRIDLYFPDEKIAVECDERGHVNYGRNSDAIRQSSIEAELDCIFVRYNPDDRGFNIGGVIHDIRLHLQTLR